MRKSKLAALAMAGLLALVGCRVPFGTETNETCSITARDTETITISCQDNHGKHTRDDVLHEPSDLYPVCQVGTFWPDCKSA